MDNRVMAYLDRIGYKGPVEPSAAALVEMQRRHLLAVPYENMDILMGKRLSLTIDDLYDKIVLRRRGGYCFELNALFGWLLSEIGFPVEHFFGRFVRGEAQLPMRRHHVLVVTAEGRRYVCDAGVGIAIPRAPLRLAPGVEQDQSPFGTYKIELDSELGWVIYSRERDRWEWLYAFTEEPQHEVDFIQPTFFCEYAPESIFNKSPMIAIRTEDGRVTLDGMTLKRFGSGEVHVRELQGDVELHQALAEHFGIRI